MRLYHRITAENGEFIGADPRAKCKRAPPSVFMSAQGGKTLLIQLFSVTFCHLYNVRNARRTR